MKDYLEGFCFIPKLLFRRVYWCWYKGEHWSVAMGWREVPIPVYALPYGQLVMSGRVHCSCCGKDIT